ncbi:single-stranded DNA-binding protein [Macrococcus equi]|uniref:single-stranded DNA-binding protein n=1 Tax=Macrococcus equi TaxID=3395462 RepID=UPI0039BE926E
MINKVILAGRISSDIDLKEFSDNLKISSFFLAVDRGKKKNAKESTVDFLRCKAFNRTATNIHSFCRKGSLVCLTGQIHNNRYEKDGETKYAVEIIIESIKFLPGLSNGKEKSPDEKWDELSYEEKLIVINDYRSRKKMQDNENKDIETEEVPEPSSKTSANYNQRWSKELNKEEKIPEEFKEQAEEIVQQFSGESSEKSGDSQSTDEDSTSQEEPVQKDEITDKSLPF